MSLNQIADNIKDGKSKNKHWFPLESNPLVMKTYTANLGKKIICSNFPYIT
jgi:hypothetical protein